MCKGGGACKQGEGWEGIVQMSLRLTLKVKGLKLLGRKLLQEARSIGRHYIYSDTCHHQGEKFRGARTQSLKSIGEGGV